MSRDVALHLGYRATVDSFRVSGLTLDVVLAASSSPSGWSCARVRGTAQTAASFARSSYARFARSALPSYRTADPELSSLYGVSIGGRARWTFLHVGPLTPLHFSVRVGHIFYHYPLMRWRRNREGWVVGIVIGTTI